MNMAKYGSQRSQQPDDVNFEPSATWLASKSSKSLKELCHESPSLDHIGSSLLGGVQSGAEESSSQ